ncbi:hypothetical protein AB0876_32155 [Mycobacterium sp. NPDC049093]
MRSSTAAVQYDLFGEVESALAAAEQSARERSTAASTFLAATPWPDLLAWWAYPAVIEAKLEHGECKASYRRGQGGTPGWAWAIWRDGLRFESDRTWQGWSHRPRWCIPWAELHTLRDNYPEITRRLHELADGRGHPRSAGWRWWTDPHCLTTGWHPDTLEAEQQPDWYYDCRRPDTAFRDRLQAWQLVTGTVHTAVLAVTPTGQAEVALA